MKSQSPTNETLNPASGAAENQISANRNKIITTWLLFVAGLIFIMVIVGGATRLTGSGLSITEWKPILGAIPPLTETDWQDAYQKYKLIPQYKELNQGMSLEEFKPIYWWEWSHRFLGRFIGLAFLVPFLFFLFKGWVAPSLKPKLWGLFALGGLQGFVGWYMVASGLFERTDVSQYRLALHLGLAVFIFAAILWVVFNLNNRRGKGTNKASQGAWLSALLITGLIYLQIIAGAFVAGLKAGFAYNTWPLMDGRLIPSDLLFKSPAWVNFFENVRTVQFDHRIIAYLIFVVVMLHLLHLIFETRSERLDQIHLKNAVWLGVITTAQIIVGIITLLQVVPLDLALIHQGGALVLLTIALWHCHQLGEALKQDKLS